LEVVLEGERRAVSKRVSKLETLGSRVRGNISVMVSR
jgi:hypothetical protein